MFNLKDYLQKKTLKKEQTTNELIFECINKYSPLEKETIGISNGIVRLVNISPHKKLQIILKKEMILQEIRTHNIHVRDIV